jgi:hypothetical protein
LVGQSIVSLSKIARLNRLHVSSFFEICAAVGVTVSATNVHQCFSQLLQEDLEQYFIHVQAMQMLSAERALQTRIFFKISKGKVKAAFAIEHPLKTAEKEQAIMRRAID